MIKVYNRWNNELIAIFDFDTFEGADLKTANLVGANLEGADFEGADFEGEILTKAPLIVGGMLYYCLITENYMRLGCQRHTHEAWLGFSDEEINKMGTSTLRFWRKHKEELMQKCIEHKKQP